MLREIIESARKTLTEKQFAELMDLVTTDVRVNRIAFGKRTSLKDAVEIAASCYEAMGRGQAA